jgi:hypothetical protein
LFPNVHGYHRFLALSETVAHLDYAVADGKLLIDKKNAHEAFRFP